MNPMLAKVTGISEATPDVVPVIANLPRRNFRDRLSSEREERDDVKRVVGEAEERGVFPSNAEEMDDNSLTVLPKKLKPVKDVVQEPSYPSDEDEKRLTPYAALTAPDATPEAMTPIDPSKVPGTSAQTFTAAELEKATPVEGQPEAEEAPVPEEKSGMDAATRTMDILLGRKRTGTPAKEREQFDGAGEVTSESAYAALKIESPDQMEAGVKFEKVGLEQGIPMPEPKPGDAKRICEAFRRFF
jgi:hypothetical protein